MIVVKTKKNKLSSLPSKKKRVILCSSILLVSYFRVEKSVNSYSSSCFLVDYSLFSLVFGLLYEVGRGANVIFYVIYHFALINDNCFEFISVNFI